MYNIISVWAPSFRRVNHALDSAIESVVSGLKELNRLEL